jgi:hypothetical protein
MLRAVSSSALLIVTGLAFVAVPVYAGWRRGRTYGVVAVVTLALSLPGALFAHERLASRLGPAPAWWLEVAFCWGAVAVALHLASLVTARLRSPLFRALVSLPGLSFAAAGALAGPWLLALLPVRATIEAAGGGTGIDWLAAVPFALVAVSLVTTCRPVAETVRITLDDDTPASVRRLPLERHRRRS